MNASPRVGGVDTRNIYTSFNEEKTTYEITSVTCVTGGS